MLPPVTSATVASPGAKRPARTAARPTAAAPSMTSPWTRKAWATARAISSSVTSRKSPATSRMMGTVAEPGSTGPASPSASDGRSPAAAMSRPWNASCK